jgi:hypothetical protein
MFDRKTLLTVLVSGVVAAATGGSKRIRGNREREDPFPQVIPTQRVPASQHFSSRRRRRRSTKNCQSHVIRKIDTEEE